MIRFVDLGAPRITTYSNGKKLKMTWKPVTCGYFDLVYSLFIRLFCIRKERFLDLMERPSTDNRTRVSNILLLFDIEGYVVVKDNPRARKNELIDFTTTYEFKYKDMMKLAVATDMEKIREKRLKIEEDILNKAKKDIQKKITDFDPGKVIIFRFTSVASDISFKSVKRV